MSWSVLVEKDGRLHEQPARDVAAALGVACLLLRDGIKVVGIEGPDGLRISSEVIRSLCEKP